MKVLEGSEQKQQNVWRNSYFDFSEKEKLTKSEKVAMEDLWDGLHEFPRPLEESFGLVSSNFGDFFLFFG